MKKQITIKNKTELILKPKTQIEAKTCSQIMVSTIREMGRKRCSHSAAFPLQRDTA